MEKRLCSIVGAGSLSHKQILKELVNASKTFLVAVDGGIDNLPRGLRPDLFVGDMDSTKKTLEEIKGLAKKVIVLKQEKDQSDLEAALKILHKRGFSNFQIFGCLNGPRFDMFLSNLQVGAFYAMKGSHIVFYDESFKHRVDILYKGELLSVPPYVPANSLISVISLRDKSEVSIKGLKYEYEGILNNVSSLGISNRSLEGKEGIVKVLQGVVAVLHSAL